VIEEVTPQIVMITALFVILVAPTVTLPLSGLLLWRYRRAVIAAMSIRAADATDVAELVAEPVVHERRSPGGGRSIEQLYHEVVRTPWRYACRYAVAGLGFAVMMAISFSFVLNVRLVSAFFLFWLVLCAWPIVLVIILTAASTRRAVGVVIGGYFAVFVVVGVLTAMMPYHAGLRLGAFSVDAQPGITPLRGAAMWVALNLSPTILLLGCLNRRVRAIGPMLLSFVTVVATGIAVAWWSMFYRSVYPSVVALTVALHARVGWILLAGVLLALVAAVVLGWLLLVVIRVGYERKRLNDQSLTLDAVWLLFAAFYSVLLIVGGLRWSLSGVVAFAVYKIVIRVWNRRAQRSPERVALLFLRVFSLGIRSERMFGAVARHWRYVGSVQFIAGPDLAMATVEPHHFLDYVSGRLSRLFVGTRQSLDSRMASLDTGADADGRFRINSFFCHDDTWQAALERLVRKTDVVLMDLRHFAPGNAGCARELNELVNMVPLHRVVLVVDATTDDAFLQDTMKAAWHAMASESPNRATSPADVPVLRLDSLGGRELRGLMHRLCSAAS
jgi:hypothetical protein